LDFEKCWFWAPGGIHDDATYCSSSPNHLRSDMELMSTYDCHVDLIHRSLRDFLMSPKVTEQLEAFSDGPFDARLFLCWARLRQAQTLDYEGQDLHAQLALGLSSYILSALSTGDLKLSGDSVMIANHLRPIVESLGFVRAHLSTRRGGTCARASTLSQHRTTSSRAAAWGEPE
jgi:hypothetical protein